MPTYTAPGVYVEEVVSSQKVLSGHRPRWPPSWGSPSATRRTIRRIPRACRRG